MATVSITVPNEYVPTLLAAIDQKYGDAVADMTATEKGVYAIKQHLKALYVAYKHHHAQEVLDAKSTLESNNDARATAEASDLQAVRDAEASAKATAETEAEDWS